MCHFLFKGTHKNKREYILGSRFVSLFGRVTAYFLEFYLEFLFGIIMLALKKILQSIISQLSSHNSIKSF